MDLKAEEEECTILSHENTGEHERTLTVSKPSINFHLLLTQERSGSWEKHREDSMKEKVLALGMTEGFFLSQKLFYQLPCNAPFLLPRKKEKKKRLICIISS